MLRILMDNIYTNQQYLKANPTWHDEDSPWKASQVMALLTRNRLAVKKVAEISSDSSSASVRLHPMAPCSSCLAIGHPAPCSFGESNSSTSKDKSAVGRVVTSLG